MKSIFTWFRSHWILSFAVVVIFAGGYYYFTTENPSEAPATRIQVETVKRGNLSVVVSGSGQIQADSQVNLKPVAAGEAIEVMAVYVKNDAEVAKDQVIAVLDNENARRDIQRAELNLRQAKIQQKKTADLNPKKTREDVRERQLAAVSVKQSEIALQDVRERLSDYTIRAPFEGIVTGLTVESGDTISQTGTLASVITKNMKVVITLNEVDAAKIRVGSTVSLTFDALPNTVIAGKVSKLDTIGIAEQGVVSYGAEISLNEQSPALKPGMSASAEISVEEKRDALLIPNSAITYEDNKAFVRIAPNRQVGGVGQANQEGGPVVRGERKEITVGLTDNVNTEVLSGLNEGDRVLVTSTVAGGAATQASAQGPNQGSILNLFRGNTPRGNFSR